MLTKHIILDVKDLYFFFCFFCPRASQAVQNPRRKDDNACNTRHTWVVVGALERPLKQSAYIGHCEFLVKYNVSQRSDTRSDLISLGFHSFSTERIKSRQKNRKMEWLKIDGWAI